MRIVRQLLLACVMAGVLGAFGSATALAANCGGAGSHQYIDPLQCLGGGGGTPSGGHPTTGRTTGTTSTTTTTPTPTTTTGTSSDTSTTSSASTTSSTSTSKSDPKSSKTLPYTGLDLGPALLLAFGLVGGGLGLRRIVADR